MRCLLVKKFGFTIGGKLITSTPYATLRCARARPIGDGMSPNNDEEINTQVSNVKHYEVFRGVEAKDIMELVAKSGLVDHLSSWEVFCFLTVLKYRLRVGDKDNPQQDLDKANRYKELLRD